MPKAAATIIEQSEVYDLLTSLVDKSLVSYEEAALGHGRYRLSETLRDYVSELPVCKVEVSELRRKHRDHFLGIAEEAENRLIGPDQAEWFDRLEEEHDNLRTAMSWSQQAQPARGLRIAAAIWRFWIIRGYQSEGRRNILDALSKAGDEANPTLRATALNGAGNLSWSLTDFAAANALLFESLNIRQELGDGLGVASSFNNLGNVAFAQGDYAAAAPLYEESLAIRRELNDKRGIAMAVGNLGRLAEALGRFTEARDLYEESLVLHRELEDLRGISISLGNMGNISIPLGLLADAKDFQEESLRIRREIGNKWGIAASLHSLGDIARKESNIDAAKQRYSESLHIRRDLGDNLGIAESLEAMASLCLERNATIQAATLWGAAERLREETGTPIWPKDRASYKDETESARAAMGEAEFAKSWQAGREMNVAHAAVLSLPETDE